ncbi:MAG: SPOR domain-containing protein [Alphaproteobacteria bacterium]
MSATPWVWRRLVALAVLVVLGAGACSSEEPPRDVALVIQMAEGGDVGAQVALGQVYEMGLGVAPDYERAIHWYRRASDAGDMFAPFFLAELHHRGIGVPKNEERAARWYRIAALRGNAAAQANLAFLYERGIGVSRDYKEATLWYERAAAGWAARVEYPLEAGFATGEERVRIVEPPELGAQAALAQPAAGEPAAGEPAARETAAPETVLPETATRETALPEIAARQAVRVHLASFRKEANAKTEWRRLNGLVPEILGGLTPRYVAVDLGDMGTFVRLLAGPLADLEAAKRLCARLHAEDQYCRLLGS